MAIQKAVSNHFEVTSLREDMLSDLIPTRTFSGGVLIGDAADVCFLWRSVATQKASHGTLSFFLSDDRLEPLFARSSYYACLFQRDGVAAVVEPDFSLWADTSLAEQLDSVRKKKIVSRIWQEHGLLVAPCLNWSGPESFSFCFAGIPVGCPVVATECRTAGAHDEDRRAFLAGLAEGVKQVEPQHVLIYGGKEHEYWLKERLPQGPGYTLIESFMSARGKIRAAQERETRERNQLQLFGGEQWADVEVQAA